MGERLGITFIKDKQIFGKAYFQWSAYSVDALLEAQMLLAEYRHGDNIGTIMTKMLHALYSNIDVMFLTPHDLLFKDKNSDDVKSCIEEIKRISQLPDPIKMFFNNPTFSERLLVGGFEPQHIEEELELLKHDYPQTYQDILSFNDLPDIHQMQISRSQGMITFNPKRFDEYDNHVGWELTIDFDEEKIISDLFYLYEKSSYLEYDLDTPFEELPKWIESATFNMMEIPFDKLNYAISITQANCQNQYGFFRYDDDTVLELKI